MAMSKSIRKELGKLRELAWHFLEGRTCFFCRTTLLPEVDIDIRFGNATGLPLDVDITIHHKNGDHDDNAAENRALAHGVCHKVYHAHEVFARLRGKKVKVLRRQDYLDALAKRAA